MWGDMNARERRLSDRVSDMAGLPPRAGSAASSGGSTTPASEKPFHYSYLKEFRVEQCKAFLQHKCNQHRPFTCFHWHFMNQRRRRPVKRRDGTFNYSPDVYCTLYDENTGICPNGDDCPYLHRTAGDTERRYHLRYYKTSTCVYETDGRGYCVKNGPHCAFAHGPHDLRSPVYDVRELAGVEDDASCLVGSLEREKGVLVDDLRWQESSFVLTYYKTEPCKRPPRLCRQGYACPFHHNNKDRRRSPKNFKYRSTPCPNVKLNDEWGDPTHCEQGDSCCYCHTRTEQQFHPEIYKSTKCNDVQQTGYCPRGPFCAFAHDEKELSAPRDLTDEPMITAASPLVVGGGPLDSEHLFSTSPHTKSLPQPIGRPERTSSASSDNFQRAVGAEVKSKSLEDEGQVQTYIRKQMQAIDADTSLDETERARRKQNLLRLSLGAVGAGVSPEVGQLQSHSLPSSVSDALEAMGLEDFEELDPGGLRDEPQEMLGTGILGQSPVAHGFMQSFQQQHSGGHSYPYSTPLGPLSPYGTTQPTGLPQHMQAMAFSPSTTPSPFHSSASQSAFHHGPQQRITSQGISPSPGPLGKIPISPTKPGSMFQAVLASPVEKSESAVLREELRQAQQNLASWQDSWKQAKAACEAWKKEAEEVTARARLEREGAIRRIEQLEQEAQSQLVGEGGGGQLRALADRSEINSLPLSKLEALRQQLRRDLDHLDSCIQQRKITLCMKCKEFPRCVLTQPCQHCVLCEPCAELLGKEPLCPYCRERITQRSTVILPL